MIATLADIAIGHDRLIGWAILVHITLTSYIYRTIIPQINSRATEPNNTNNSPATATEPIDRPPNKGKKKEEKNRKKKKKEERRNPTVRRWGRGKEALGFARGYVEYIYKVG
ncbi:hypothetical protein LRP52_44870 [Photobacterium sp. ZSDE20]|nr:hypothetical protein [Photobacterium sp. ZSDE20]